ncbi:MAG TPA: 30S ribosomal protein S16 [Candidatus Saccharimonadales bacterium]
MQRTGRKGHAMFRIVVQESRLTPTSGKVVAQLGSFDPHSKTAQLNVEKASLYLKNGAQPSGRAALLLQKEGVELPSWVKLSDAKSRTTRHPDKLRKNQPAAEAEPADAPTDDAPADAPEAVTGTTES